MSLTGISPTRRRPGTLREFVFAAGPGSSGVTHKVCIYANKTSAGTETTNTLGTVALDLQDVIARFGRRSEARWLYQLFTAADQEAPIHIIAVPEGAGSAASVTYTFADGAATATTTGVIDFQGESTEFGISVGDTAIVQAAAFVTAFNNASEGGWMATAAIGGGGSEHIVTVTGSQLGTRLDPLFNHSLRFRYKHSTGTTATKSAVTPGATDDDFTLAYAQAATGEFLYHVNPKFSTSAPTATDNGVGEGIAFIRDQALPANGKEQTMHFGLVGTQAQATTVAVDADANSTYAFFYRAEDNDWTAGMIAAHMCGIVRLAYEGHPSENITGWRNTDTTPMLGPPDPYDKTDRPTDVEIEADLANGITPIAFDSNGSPYIVRHVTSYSEVSAGVKDYRASEGHTPFAIMRTWEEVEARWNAEKQRGVAEDPLPGQKPLPKTSTPSQARGILLSVIEEFAGPRPLGIYEGPILSPSAADVAEMKASIDVVKIAGGIESAVDFKALEHNLKGYFKMRQTNRAY